MQIIVPQVWVCNGGVLRDKRIDDLLVPFSRNELLFRVGLIKLWATEKGILFAWLQGLDYSSFS